MKRIFLTILIIALIILMCGCSSSDPTLGDVKLHNDFIDPATGVHYLIIQYDWTSGFGVAPRYNSDGTLMVED